MNTEKFQFKTNLNCSNCVSKVKGSLDATAGICSWDVNTDLEDKILTVESSGITQEEIIAMIQSKGFRAEPLDNNQ